jgi:hypothetical protein
MMRKLKVYGGRFHHRGKVYRAVVAASSQREVARIAEVSLHEVSTYWSETGNAAEIAAARKQPETLLLHPKEWQDEIVPLSELAAALSR